MPFNNLAELDKFFRIIQPNDLLGKYRVVNFKGQDAGKSNFVNNVVGLLINTGENQASSGVPSMDEIVTQINSLMDKADDPAINDFHNFLRVYADKKLNKSETYWKGDRNQTISFAEIIKGSATGPKLGVVMSSSPFVTLNVRDTNKVSVFLNAVPTLEFTRAVPFLDVRFQFKRPVDGSEKRLRVPSLLKFLDGAVVPQKTDAAMAGALIDKQANIDGTQQDVYRAGMELFTSPQTLVNPSSARPINRFVRVLDPFRPFMSIEQFEITAAPTVGLFSYKTAKLTILLHDRSRLGEISDLVRPEVYTNTTLSISYGWKHPSGIGNENAFGDLINRMAIQNEKYGIVNCSFQFDATGQCRIVLQLAMKGSQDIRVVKVADSKDYQDQTKFLDQLTKDVAQLREDAGLKKPEGLGKEIRAYSVLDMAERGELLYEPEQLKEIRDLVTRLRKANGANRAAAQELASKLDELFKKEKGAVEVLKNTIDSNIEKKFKELEEGEDPFLDRSSKEYQQFVIEVPPGQRKGKRLVSLAKVMLTFIGLSLQALGNVDEVQFFFYQFNGQAGQLGDTNIGSFPVEIQHLKDIFRDHARAKGNPNMSVYEFVMLLQGAVIQDPRAIGYGLRQAYTPRTGKKDPEVIKGQKIEDVLSNAVKNKGSFRYPAVEAYIETLGGRPLSAGELASEKAAHDIMRIHVYDKAASPYEPMLQMVRSQSDLQDVIKIDQGSSKNSQNVQSTIQNAIQLANASGLSIQRIPTTGKYKIEQASLQNLKTFITEVVPTITYGSNNTAIINATVQTQQNQLLSTVQMMREAGRQNNTEPNGSAHGGIPLRVIPAQLDINTFGCPLLSINQQFFVDFQTGTTIDNLYLLTHLTHTLKPGKFETHVKMVPLDAYGVFESVIAKVEQLKDYLKDT